MDSDDMMTVYNEGDQKESSNKYNESNNQLMRDSRPKITFGDSDDEINEISNEGIYDDLDDVINEYVNEEEACSTKDEYYLPNENQNGEGTNGSFKFKPISKSDRNEISKNMQQMESDVDEVIVNSHLQEIVDIKNQIRELQDILHDKPLASGERLKFEDCEDESKEFELNSPSQSVQLKKSSLSKHYAKRKFARKIGGSQLFKRAANEMSVFDRFRTPTSSASLEKFEKKRRLKRNETVETELASGSDSIFPQKKIANESAKLRLEKKTKPVTEDAIAEDQVADSKLQEIENIPPNVTSSLRKILQTTAHTPEEKYRVLDARDKLYKIMRDKDPTAKTGALVGTCPDMCPEKERLQREFQFQIPMFEMVNYPKNTSLNHNYAVKQYCRSSADQEEPLPHELRPINVLSMTMSYLLHNVADHCELSDENLGEWYTFMWDRTRALRKELTQQGACNLESVKLVEQCARFHIHCAERLVDQDISIYDDKINTENLTKCLQTLKYMYRDLANEDIYCPNESEFVCYSLLLNLNNTSVLTELSDMAERVMSSEPVRFALDIMSAWETRNYVRFFNLVNRTSYLNCCILRRYFLEMRLYAVKTMIRSYCTKYYSPQIPIYRFVENLRFEGIDECSNFLSLCNFNINQKNDTLVVDFNRLAFQSPATPFPAGRAYFTIGEKKKLPFSMIMAGGELPPKTYEDHIPQNSFTRTGELKLDSLLCKELMDFANSPSAPAPPPAQPAKSKLFESKGDLQRSRESVSQFSDVFGKPQKFLLESKDVQANEKKYPEERSLFSRLGEKQTSSFASSSASIFDKNLGTGNSFNVSFNREGSKTESIFAGKNLCEQNSDFAQKQIFNVENPAIIFDSGSALFGNSHTNGSELPRNSPLLFPTQTEPANFNFKITAPPPQAKMEEEDWKENESEKLETESTTQESKLKKKKEEEEEENRLRSILLESVKKSRQEAERREKEKKQAAEEEERREREKKAQEEKIRLEELRVQEKIRKAKLLKLEEMAKIEEEKRKSDADLKLKMDLKMFSLKEKYLQWKVLEFFNKWRLKTWVTIEARKMKEYFKDVHQRYPAVCTEEHLNGNPYGLIIPNVLILQKCQSSKDAGKKLERRNERLRIEGLPFINVKEVVAKLLETRSRRLLNNVDPFPWKVVFSVPGETECNSWKDIETFIEMNFVDRQSWKFGKENGALCYHEGCHSTFRYKISVRRVRGSDLYEGTERNADVMTGSNGLIFVISEDGDISVSKKRLMSVLSSRRPLPQVPLIILVLGDALDDGNVEGPLELKSLLEKHLSEYHIVRTSGSSKEELVSKVVMCLNLAAENSSPVVNLGIVKLSEFCCTNWFECVWRRMEISLSNYGIVLGEPNFLIECYNSSLDELLRLFLDSENEKYTLIGDEFLEKKLIRPKMTESYKEKLTETFYCLKLPDWPKEIPKSCEQLKYQIHQYCKKVAGEKKKMKELKWLLYRIIRTCLLWKGLDIYCNEDIENILFSFPWIQFFQELSGFVVQELVRKMKSEDREQSLVYRIDKIKKFNYESSLISKYFDRYRNNQRNVLERRDSSPRLEHDSVIFAYSAALEREKNKRKREEVVEENLDDIFQLVENKRQLLQEEKKDLFDVVDLKNGFQNLSARLDELKRRVDENAKIFQELELE